MVALDPRRRSMLRHYKILSVAPLATGNWSRCMLPLAWPGLASPRDRYCVSAPTLLYDRAGVVDQVCVRKGIPVDSCCTATEQCVTSIVKLRVRSA